MARDLLPDRYFVRLDDGPDPDFYALPRKLVHVDDAAIAAIGLLYAELLPADGLLLDLMSSWRSHLPPALASARVMGLGLNAEEMADNPHLQGAVVHDLNYNPRLPFADASFDGAMCAVSIQYLVRPVEVLREVNRVLRPGAPFVVTFSNRCFPAKAVAVWRATDDRQHVSLVATYFRLSGGWGGIMARDCSPGPFSDPLYGVWARKGVASSP